MSTIHVRVLTPEGVYKELDTPILNIDTIDGARGILPNHMPLVTSVTIGRMSTEENGKREEYAVSGGLLYFRDNNAEILTDAIESKEEIDVDRAERAKKRAEERLAQVHKEELDFKRAELALKRALNRLAVKNGQ